MISVFFLVGHGKYLTARYWEWEWVGMVKWYGPFRSDRSNREKWGRIASGEHCRLQRNVPHELWNIWRIAFGPVINKTADRKTIMNYHTPGQTRKTIIDYHGPFDQGFRSFHSCILKQFLSQWQPTGQRQWYITHKQTVFISWFGKNWTVQLRRRYTFLTLSNDIINFIFSKTSDVLLNLISYNKLAKKCF